MIECINVSLCITSSKYLFKDDEINVMELDFALKAVNYNLISDAELTYVNKVR